MSERVAQREAQAIRMKCRRMPDPTLFVGDLILFTQLSSAMFRIMLSGETEFIGWYQLGFTVLIAALFVVIAASREMNLINGVLHIDGMWTRQFDIGRASQARLTLLSGNVVILDLQRANRWKTLRLEGDDIGPMREALLALVPREHVIDLRPRGEA